MFSRKETNRLRALDGRARKSELARLSKRALRIRRDRAICKLADCFSFDLSKEVRRINDLLATK